MGLCISQPHMAQAWPDKEKLGPRPVLYKEGIGSIFVRSSTGRTGLSKSAQKYNRNHKHFLTV